MNWYKQIPYIQKTLDLIFNHSFQIKKGQNLFIEFFDIPEEIIKYIAQYSISKEITIHYNVKFQEITNSLAELNNEHYYENLAKIELAQLKLSDYFLGIRAINNTVDFGQVSMEKKQTILENYLKPVHYDYRNKNIPWLYFRLPTEAMAQQTNMATEAFIDYFYNAIHIDYNKLALNAEPFKKFMLQSNNVTLESPGTKLQFSIKDMPVIIDNGKVNLPDGEVRTVPNRNSVNGYITFNVPSTYYGFYFSSICLHFKDGKVIEARSDGQQQNLQQILDTDEGARYVGEFAIGINPNINKPINDILFDEKIFGSIHLALGNAFHSCDNGNRSCIHWDLILDLNSAQGGGKLHFDDKLVLKDGVFLIDF